MKVSSSSKKEPTTKVEKIEEKLRAMKIANSELKKVNRKERRKTRMVIKSREKLRKKYRKKTNEIKGLKKKLSGDEKAKGHHYGIGIIGLCILLRIVGGCSYRSIPRILSVLKMVFDVPWEKIPCANTVENWVSKMGLYHMQSGIERLQQKCEKVSLIIDENLRIGNERMLMLLATPSEKLTEQALTYEDVEVIYICGKKSWTGEKIEQEVEKLMEEKGMEIEFILSDEDSKLVKSARLLGQDHVADIGHAIGNCLRKVFLGNQIYQAMIKLVGRLQSKSVNQKLTFLRPPKQRTKARFMNLKPLIKWGITMLTRFEKLEEEEQLFFENLKQHRMIFNTLNCCIDLSEQVSSPLKKEGLNQSTLKNFKLKISDLRLELARQVEEQINTKSKPTLIVTLVEQYMNHLEKYAQRYEEFLGKKQGNYPVSSDVIESIFGKHKNMVSNNALVGMTILDLELAVHCQATPDILKTVRVSLEDVSITSLLDWREIHSSDNQALRRKLFFKKRA